MKIKYIFFIQLMLWVFACNNDDNPGIANTSFERDKGIFILNEGIFTQGNASVDYYDWINDSLYTGIYEKINGEKAGDVLQSMTIQGKYAYLALNNSSCIKKVSIEDFKLSATIKGLQSPRYILPVNKEKLYVSDLYSGKIYVISPIHNTITKEIYTGQWTETWALYEDMAFVTCPWFYSTPASKKILVLNTATDEITDSISVCINPQQIAADKNGKIWVLCGGNSYENIKGGLFKIDANTTVIEDSMTFGKTQQTFNNSLVLNEGRDTLFILYNDVYSLAVKDGISKLKKIFTPGKDDIYGMSIDNKRQLLYIMHAPANSKGYISVYTKKGIKIKTIKAGYYPNSVVPY